MRLSNFLYGLIFAFSGVAYGRCEMKIRDDYFLMEAGIKKSICLRGVCKSIPMQIGDDFVRTLLDMKRNGCLTDLNVNHVLQGVLSIDRVYDVALTGIGGKQRVSVFYQTSDSLFRPIIGVFKVEFYGAKVVSKQKDERLVVCDSCRIIPGAVWDECRDSLLNTGANSNLDSPQ